MLVYACTEGQSLSSVLIQTWRQRSAQPGQAAAGPKGAPPTIPPIIINPFRYDTPGPAIDPRQPPPAPPVTPPARPSMSLAGSL